LQVNAFLSMFYACVLYSHRAIIMLMELLRESLVSKKNSTLYLMLPTVVKQDLLTTLPSCSLSGKLML